MEHTIETFSLRPPFTDPFEATGGRWSPIRPWAPRYAVERSAGDPISSGSTAPETGAIHLLAPAFESPEALARAIFHETQHWVFDIVEEGRGRRHVPPSVEFERHAAIYQREADFAATLRPGSDADARKLAAQFRYQAQECRRRRLTRGALASDRSLDNWLRGVEGESLRSYSNLSDFLQPPPTPSGNPDLLLEWRESAAALVEAKDRVRAREEADAARDRLFRSWADSCGLDWCGPDPLDFRVKNYSDKGFASFRFRDERQAQAAFVIAGACARPDEGEPCIDGMQALEDCWKDDEFRDRLYLAEGSSDYMAYCMVHVVQNLKPKRRRFSRLSDLVREFVERRRRRNEAEDKRSDPPAPEPSEPTRTPQPRPAHESDCGREWDSRLGLWIRCVPQ